MKNLVKLSLFICGYLACSELYAVEILAEYTQPVEGTPPELAVGAKGCLAVGEEISIDKNDPNSYRLTDLDGDEIAAAPIFGGDDSFSTLTWLLFDPNETDFSHATSIGNTTSIIIPPEALGKRIGFQITPTTKVGNPKANVTLNVTDLRLFSQVNADGVVTKTNNALILCTQDGNVQQPIDPTYYSYIFEVDAMTGKISESPIKLEEFLPQTRKQYELKIFEDSSMTKEITANYSGKVKWYLHEEMESPSPQNLVNSVLNHEFRFRVQTTNLNAQRKSLDEESEQGLKLTVMISP